MDALKAWPLTQAAGYVIPYKMQRVKERKTALLKIFAIVCRRMGFEILSQAILYDR